MRDGCIVATSTSDGRVSFDVLCRYMAEALGHPEERVFRVSLSEPVAWEPWERREGEREPPSFEDIASHEADVLSAEEVGSQVGVTLLFDDWHPDTPSRQSGGRLLVQAEGGVSSHVRRTEPDAASRRSTRPRLHPSGPERSPAATRAGVNVRLRPPTAAGHAEDQGSIVSLAAATAEEGGQGNVDPSMGAPTRTSDPAWVPHGAGASKRRLEPRRVRPLAAEPGTPTPPPPAP